VNIIGVSAYYHDSAACLVQDGEIKAAAQEERFSRKKHDHRFPTGAFEYCLREGGLKGPEDVDYIVFYDKPLMKFERLLETYLAYAPKGASSFLKAMPLWLKEKLHMRTEIRKACGYEGRVLFGEHHESHAASAFYPSPFDEAAIICFDGVGEWATTSYWTGRGHSLESKGEILFPHSIGLLYSAFTYYTGFKVNSGEYKVMGLAPYGQPKYVDAIYEHLLDLRDDGSFHLNMDYFDYCAGLTMTNAKFDALFGGPPRKAEARLSQREMDLAASVQKVTEDAMLRIARHVHKETGLDNLCLAGGVALNCVGNGRLLREGPFKKIFIQPAAGDAGGALGAALAVWHRYLDKPRATFTGGPAMDRQRGSYLGPAFGDADVQKVIDARSAKATRLDDAALLPKVAGLIAEGKIIGWMNGRMEFGPRALGARSILGDARAPEMQKRMNLKIKFRESFRPFAPSVLAEQVSEWFDIDRESPYMLLVAEVAKKQQIPMTAEQEKLFGIEKLNVPRSTIPAATHVDYSARIQTVHRETNPRYYDLIDAFFKQTGCPVVVNTSFNVRGEPIVCTPEDAYRCFMRSDIDVLVVDQWVFLKEDQPVVEDDKKWMQEFELD
jgi:carbamoyltransferase